MESEERELGYDIKVSVVCAWYERSKYITDAVDSLLAQDCSSFEVIIVNDGSKDPKVKAILDGYDDPRLKVVHQENVGFTKAIKNAIRVARGEFIAIHGAGDVSHSQRLSKQLTLFEENPKAGIVGCYYQKRKAHQSELAETIKPTEARNGSQDPDFFRTLLLSHGELMYRRSVYDDVGGYRDFFVVGQGSDLWGRMLRASELLIVPEVLYEQRIFEDGVSTNYLKVFHRALLHGVMEDERKAIDSGTICPLKDPEGLYMPLYLVSRNDLSKRYLRILLMCYALELPEAPYFLRLAIANSNLSCSMAAWLFGLLPFKTASAKLLVSRSTMYNRLICDLGLNHDVRNVRDKVDSQPVSTR